MAEKKYTQEQQVIDTMRRHGGYATLGNLYHDVDTSAWATKTPNESIRRIVQESKEIFRIQPGLWALNESRETVLARLGLDGKESMEVEIFTHGFYQGLLVEIGNMKEFITYVPAQDQNRKFLEHPLRDVCTTINIPEFGRETILSRAKSIDVIWFNNREMPNSFFEVEHSTDIQNSLGKYCDLQDYNSRFFIVADENRKEQYNKVLGRTMFNDIRDRVAFRSYKDIVMQYESMCKLKALPANI